MSRVADIRPHLQGLVQQALATLGVTDVPVELSPPKDPSMGELCFPCFPLAKVLRRPPPAIAQDLAARLPASPLLAGADAASGYLNLRLAPAELARIVVGEVFARGEEYGAGDATGEHWMVEYSSPNTNKPLHLGHIRNILLGTAIARIIAHRGHRVTRTQIVNDRGVHICKSMLAYQRWGAGDPALANIKGDRFVGDLYVLFEQKFQEEYLAWQATAEAEQRFGAWLRAQTFSNPIREEKRALFFKQFEADYFNEVSSLGGEVRGMLRAWEAEDPEIRAQWRRMNDWVLQGFAQTYARLSAAFEQMEFESDTYLLGKSIVDAGLAKGLLQKRDNGAVVFDLTRVGLEGEKVLLRGDGTSLYTTQDLGCAVQRFAQGHLDRLLYVVGDEQNYHFDVLFRILGVLYPEWAGRCQHLRYGMIRLPEGRMKSREGTVVDADALMDEVHALARAETQARAAEGKVHTDGISGEELHSRAEAIGLAALKYHLLKFNPRTSFEYNPKESIDFLGQTGPYCLFNYARTRSLLRRAGGEVTFDPDALALLVSAREQDVVRLIAQFHDVLLRAEQALDPSRVAEYVFDLGHAFAVIFTDREQHPILQAEDPRQRSARLQLAYAVGATMKIALGLLGIDVLEEM
jgi:arginyl-tRNA synthetase